MTSEFWINKWTSGEIGFHQAEIHPQLQKYMKRFNSGKILVPLCGKSLDMIALANSGHTIIGVELSELACKSFFAENSIEYTQTSILNFILFKSPKITIWCGDFFKLPDHVWNEVSGIYDRAALIALPEEIRKNYTLEISNKSSRPFNMLLITLEYDSKCMDGPPFSVSDSEVKDRYKKFAIQKLYTQKFQRVLKVPDPSREITMTENVYWIEKN